MLAVVHQTTGSGGCCSSAARELPFTSATGVSLLVGIRATSADCAWEGDKSPTLALHDSSHAMLCPASNSHLSLLSKAITYQLPTRTLQLE